MKTTILVVGSVLALAGVAAVLFMSGGSDATTTATSSRGAAPSVANQPTPTVPPVLPQGTDSVATGDPLSGGDGSDYPKEYMVGGVKVRDHRSGNNKPLDVPPNPHPANARELPSELTHDISQQLRKKLYECATAVPATAKGAKPKLEGQLTVGIKDHVLSIANMVLQIRDIDGPSADALRQCIQDKSTGLTAAARDQADLSDYGIAITFAIP